MESTMPQTPEESVLPQTPAATLAALRQAIDKALDDTFAQPLETVSEDGDSLTSTTLYQTDRHYLVKTALPGVEPDQIEVVIHNDQLFIRAEAVKTNQQAGEGMTRLDRYVERYYRSVGLPGPVNTEAAKAVLENSVLRVTLPRVPMQPPKRIAVQGGAVSETAQQPVQ